MAQQKDSSPLAQPALEAAPESYTVLARRYRPQQFADIVGQEAIARALVNALESNRVAHAYLFTGARGVGKTSTARILAKALNCKDGPTARPCDRCDMCCSIATGEDVDVLEIDGASNRGIDEVRDIRQNVHYRPSRARYKIYIIDEVHMLTPPAFNALLKTLEEPPGHVKFIFATTEVQRIPVTILSRCQRFDFAGIGTPRIVERLRQIVSDEGVPADDDVLELIARRAAGSMRDAQSLLDQLLAFGSGPPGSRLTTEQFHRLLGTATDDRVLAMASAVLERDAKKALKLLSEAADEGVNLGELLDQLIDYWRDLMIVHCGGVEAENLSLSARHRPILAQQAQTVSLDTILAGLDILAATKARLRASQHGRVLMEIALVRLGRLDNLVSIAQLADWLRSAGGSRPDDKGALLKEPSSPSQPAGEGQNLSSSQGSSVDSLFSDAQSPGPPAALTEATLQEVWRKVLAQVGPMLASDLGKADSVAISGPKTLVIRFAPRYNLQREHCQEPQRLSRAEDALRIITGQPWSLRVESGSNAAATSFADAEKPQSRYRRQRTEVTQEPLVKRAIERLEAQIVQVDEGFGIAPSQSSDRPALGENGES